jgi:hypothetical protein
VPADDDDESPGWEVAAPAPSSRGSSDLADRGGAIALGGAALLFFACFLPRARATRSLFFVTKDGIDTDAGVIMLLLLTVVIALVIELTLLRPPPSRVGAVLVLLGGMAGVGIAIYQMFHVDDAFDDLLEQVQSRLGVEARVGVGLYLSLLASAIIIIVGGVLAFVQGQRAQESD